MTATTTPAADTTAAAAFTHGHYVRRSKAHPTWHLQLDGQQRTACGDGIGDTPIRVATMATQVPAKLCTKCRHHLPATATHPEASAPPAPATPSAWPAPDGFEVAMLPVDQVDPAPDNPRRDLGDLTELAASIAAQGILEPLLVTPRGERWLLVCGARRLAAARQAGRAVVPCIVKQLDEAQRIAAMVIENVQRSSLAPLEEAVAYQRLLAATGMTQRELEKAVGTSQATISKRLALLELPDETRAAVDAGKLTLRQAGELHKLVQAGAAERAAQLTREATDEQSPHADWNRQRIEVFVERDLELIHAARRAEESLQQLTEAKARILKEPKQGWWDKQPRPLARQEHGRCVIYQDSHVKVGVKAHAGEGCHAATICGQHGEIVWMCNDPKLHATGTDREDLEERERWRRENDERLAADKARVKALNKAAKVRTVAARELLAAGVGPSAGQLPVGQLLNDAIRTMLDLADTGVQTVACDLLGLEPFIEKTSYGGTWKNRRRPLQDLLDAGEHDRVGYALILARPEHHLRDQWRSWGDDLARRYLDRLVAAGYELSEAERAKLEQADTEAAEPGDDEDLDDPLEDDGDGEDLDVAAADSG